MTNTMEIAQNVKVKSTSARCDEFPGSPSENVSNSSHSVKYNGLIKFYLIFQF